MLFRHMAAKVITFTISNGYSYLNKYNYFFKLLLKQCEIPNFNDS